ncbi:hypothetical protein MLD38_010107 [Melastoma candidum]|uniref:Uncharacterized protein n=1 Tax=Melastoma candidum TaxID=119954 RepID=A0ACB9QYS8_9MYRT|nr:hypothetical protein MLD38_010107 [Melastoma candidum]
MSVTTVGYGDPAFETLPGVFSLQEIRICAVQAEGNGENIRLTYSTRNKFDRLDGNCGKIPLADLLWSQR